MKQILIIGFGKFGSILFEKCNALGSVGAICTKTITPALRAFCQSKGIALSTDYHNALGNLPREALVVIATPVASHYPIVKDCLMASYDVLVEKPASLNPNEVADLMATAKQQNKRLYVDDVFLYRPEFERQKQIVAQSKGIKSAFFALKKYGTFTDHILDAHVYHDMYLLVDLLGDDEARDIEIIGAEDPLLQKRIDRLAFRFHYRDVMVNGDYNRTSREKEKQISLALIDDGVVTWKNNTIDVNGANESYPKSDALSAMVKAVIEGAADYQKNNTYAMKASLLTHAIRNALG